MNQHSEEPQSERLPELVDVTTAGRQEPAERLVPVSPDQARDGLRPLAPEDVNEALVSLIKQEGLRSMFLSYLRDNSQRLEQAIRRGDEFQERFARERGTHDVTRNDLKHASTRTAGQTLLQILGGGFFAWGLSEIGKGWGSAAFIGIGLAMVIVGCLPIITIPWARRE